MDSRWVTLGMTSIDSKSPLFSPFAIMLARVLQMAGPSFQTVVTLG